MTVEKLLMMVMVLEVVKVMLALKLMVVTLMLMGMLNNHWWVMTE
jgi:hypothetical protein